MSNSTESPFLTHTSATVPVQSAVMSLNIFIASILHTTVFGVTLLPTVT